MNKYLFIFSMSFIVIALNNIEAQDTATLTYEEYIKEWRAAEDEFRNYLPKIELLEDEYADDPEFLIGSALLYEKYYTSKVEAEKIDKYWERVLSIDPNNKVALATTIRNDQYWYLQKQSLIFDELDRKIKSAQKRETGSITIKYQMNMGPYTIVRKNGEKILQPAHTSQPQLYKYFAKGDNKDIVITDFDATLVQLKTKLDVELAESLDIISNAEKHDPDNALYNYLKAHIYFKLGYNDYGLNQIKIGTKKEYLKTYYPQIIESVAKVLELIDFPEPLRQFIKASYSSTGLFIRDSILNEDLEPLIAEYGKQDKNETIKEILDMVSMIAQQLRKEPMPSEAMQKGHSEIVEKWIEKIKINLSMESSR